MAAGSIPPPDPRHPAATAAGGTPLQSQPPPQYGRYTPANSTAGQGPKLVPVKEMGVLPSDATSVRTPGAYAAPCTFKIEGAV